MKKLIILIGLIFLTIFSFGQVKITTGNVNFRTSPEITENKICVVPKGTELSVVQEATVYEYWTRVTYNGTEGYVHNDFIKDKSTVSNNLETNTNNTKDGVKYYYNSKGEKVQSPTHYDSAPAGATAECNDGTYSFSHSRRGTCSHHGGVKRWLK